MDDAEVEALIRRASDGDADAADALLLRYGSGVRRAIHHRLGDDLRARVDTDDVYQSAISSALQDMRGIEYKGEQAFLGWLRTVAERRVLMAARHHRAAKRDPSREEPIGTSPAVPSRHASPSSAAVRNETTEGVRAAMQHLADTERQVVQLHSFDGLSFREVAERLGMSSKKVAHDAFRRALRKMADHL